MVLACPREPHLEGLLHLLPPFDFWCVRRPYRGGAAPQAPYGLIFVFACVFFCLCLIFVGSYRSVAAPQGVPAGSVWPRRPTKPSVTAPPWTLDILWTVDREVT